MTGAVSALNARSSSTSTPRSSPRSPRARSRPAASPSPRPSALVSSEVRAGALVTPTYPSPRRTRAHHRESRASVAVHAAAAVSDDMDDGAPIKTTERLTPDAKRVVLLCAVTMLLASADRTIFSLGSLAIARDLSLSMSTVGLLQSAFFWGYGVTQVLGGVAADKFGGAKVLLMGLGLWSVGVAMIPAATLTPAPIAVIVAARVLFGAASGCTMPASAAAVASCVPAERRSSSLSLIFTFFNCGSAFGLLLAGSMIQTIGWQAVFLGVRGGRHRVVGDRAHRAPTVGEERSEGFRRGEWGRRGGSRLALAAGVDVPAARRAGVVPRVHQLGLLHPPVVAPGVPREGARVQFGRQRPRGGAAVVSHRRVLVLVGSNSGLPRREGVDAVEGSKADDEHRDDRSGDGAVTDYPRPSPRRARFVCWR